MQVRIIYLDYEINIYVPSAAKFRNGNMLQMAKARLCFQITGGTLPFNLFYFHEKHPAPVSIDMSHP